MILTALAAAAMFQTNHVVEILDPTMDAVDIEAVVRLPELTWHQRGLLEEMAGSLVQDTPTFSRNQIEELASHVGQRMRVSIMEDHIRVSFVVAPQDVESGISMVGSVLREPVFTEDSLKATSEDLQFRRFGYWRQALKGVPFDPPKYTRRDVAELKAVIFRPENVTVGVCGKFVSGQPSAKWAEVESQWQPGRIPRLYDDQAPAKSLAKLESSLSVFELRGPVFTATDAGFSTKVLALFALGSGKAGSLFRVAREKLGWSYRQESVLWPTPTGFAPRLLVVQSDKTDIDKRGETLRTELLADVKTWTEQDRLRALGIAQACMTRGVEYSPFYFHPDRTISSNGADDAFMAAYWQMKTGSPWAPSRLLGQMGLVTTEDMKAAAQEMLAASILKTYPGS